MILKSNPFLICFIPESLLLARLSGTFLTVKTQTLIFSLCVNDSSKIRSMKLDFGMQIFMTWADIFCIQESSPKCPNKQMISDSWAKIKLCQAKIHGIQRNASKQSGPNGCLAYVTIVLRLLEKDEQKKLKYKKYYVLLNSGDKSFSRTKQNLRSFSHGKLGQGFFADES